MKPKKSNKKPVKKKADLGLNMGPGDPIKNLIPILSKLLQENPQLLGDHPDGKYDWMQAFQGATPQRPTPADPSALMTIDPSQQTKIDPIEALNTTKKSGGIKLPLADMVMGALTALDTLIPEDKPRDPVKKPQLSYNEHAGGTGSQAIYGDGGKVKGKKSPLRRGKSVAAPVPAYETPAGDLSDNFGIKPLNQQRVSANNAYVQLKRASGSLPSKDGMVTYPGDTLTQNQIPAATKQIINRNQLKPGLSNFSVNPNDLQPIVAGERAGKKLMYKLAPQDIDKINKELGSYPLGVVWGNSQSNFLPAPKMDAGGEVSGEDPKNPKKKKKSTPIAPTTPPSGLTPQQMNEWNMFQDFVQQKGMAGSPLLDKRNKNLGAQLFQQFKTAHPEISINYDIVPAAQAEFSRVKQNNQQYAQRQGEATGSNWQNISHQDGWYGSLTSQQRFIPLKIVNADGTIQDKGLLNGQGIPAADRGGSTASVKRQYKWGDAGVIETEDGRYLAPDGTEIKMNSGGSIHIDPSKKGTFTVAALKMDDGGTVETAAGDPKKIQIKDSKGYKSGSYDQARMLNVIKAAKAVGVDPYTALAIGLQETGFGSVKLPTTEKTRGRRNRAGYGTVSSSLFGKKDLEAIDKLYTTTPGLDLDALRMAYAIKLKQDYGRSLGYKDEALQLQAYQGYGMITPKTYGGSTKAFGVDISAGIDPKKNPLYGNRIIQLRSDLQNNPEIQGLFSMESGGSIHINPSKKGTFTAAATKHGMGVQEFASHVLSNKEKFSPAMVKKANFARNAAHFHHMDSGGLMNYDGPDQQMDMDQDNQIETISNNPYAGPTYQFKGPSHEKGGIDIAYGGKKVEVEGQETAIKDQQGNLHIMGNLKVPGSNKKFKDVSKQIAKMENKASTKKKKSLELFQTMETSAIPSLKGNSAQLMQEGADMMHQKAAQYRNNLAMLQDAMLQHADQKGVDPKKLFARNGLKVKAGDGWKFETDKSKIDKKILAFVDLVEKKGYTGRVSEKGGYSKRKTSKGRVSRHASGQALDMIFKDKDAYRKILNDPELTKYLIDNGLTAINENDPEIAKQTGADIGHIHIGYDQGTPISDAFRQEAAKLYKDHNGSWAWGTLVAPPAIQLPADAPEGDKQGLLAAYIPVDPKEVQTVDPQEVQTVDPQEVQTVDPQEVQTAEPQDVTYTGNFNFTNPDRSALPSNISRLKATQILPEVLAVATNHPEAVRAQQYNPEYLQPYQVSFQDQLNENQATFRSLEKIVQDPEALSILAAQKYGANQKVLGDQFRTNQAIEADVIGKNTALFNDAQLKNLDIMDQQYVRQQTANSKTRYLNQEALSSVSSKVLQNELDNKKLAAYENLYDYRFQDSDKDGIPDVIKYMGPDAAFNFFGSASTPQEDPNTVTLQQTKRNFGPFGEPKGSQEITKEEQKRTRKTKGESGLNIPSLYNQMVRKMR